MAKDFVHLRVGFKAQLKAQSAERSVLGDKNLNAQRHVFRALLDSWRKHGKAEEEFDFVWYRQFVV
ncbi:MAG: hypothetical protein ACI8V2_005374 [Candidatus Latescibacterota bacterium]|jgi:hypothetical protein